MTMDREYIEREKALEKVIEVKHHDPELSGVVLHRYIKEIDLKDIPAADVAEVVRCKDCKWYSELACGERELLGSQGWCNEVMARPMPSNGFCSFGERKKGHGQTNGIQNGI